MTDHLPEGWITLGEAYNFLRARVLEHGDHFILDHWDCKYIDARIDMRTGKVLLSAGNGRTLDREDLIVPATRYYMGRQTIGVTAHCRALAKIWPALSAGVRDTLRREIGDAFERDDAMRSDPVCSPSYYPLGTDIDREAWELVRNAWLSETTGEGQ